MYCLCCSMYCLFCVVLCIICVYMCTVLLPPGGHPIAVKYIIHHIISWFLNPKQIYKCTPRGTETLFYLTTVVVTFRRRVWLRILTCQEKRVVSLKSVPAIWRKASQLWHVCKLDWKHKSMKTAKYSPNYLFDTRRVQTGINPLNSELNPICSMLALLAHHFLHVSRIMVK